MRSLRPVTLLGALLLLVAPASEAQVVTRLVPTNPDFLDDFAETGVALTDADDGTWALIGAPGDNDYTGDAGSVFAYHRTEDGWQLHDQLFAPGEPYPEGGFGGAVALSGRIAVVTETGRLRRDRAYVLRRDGEGLDSEWVVEATLEAEALADETHVFGLAVALDTSAEALAAGGEVAFVGAAPEETLEPVPGVVHVFRRAVDEEGAGTWAEEAVLQANDEDVLDRFGNSLDAASGEVLIGAFLEGFDFETGGAAYVYRHDEAAAGWVQEVRLAPEGLPQFGGSVALGSGEGAGWALVGAPGEDCPGPSTDQCGLALVYRRSGDGTWSEVQRLEPEGPEPTEAGGFGAGVAFSSGETVITAPYRWVGGVRQAGAAYRYGLTEDGLTLTGKLAPPEPRVNSRFGLTLALSETAALMGTLETLGAAYVFDLNAPVASEPGVAATEPLGFEVWPNPTRAVVTAAFVSERPGEAVIAVSDVLGRIVERRDLGRLSAGRREVALDLSGLAPGLYVVRLIARYGTAGRFVTVIG